MTWTEWRTDTLKTMWANGATGTDIGIVVGKTRNACIGKVHRLGLASRDQSRSTRYHTGKRSQAKRRRKAQQYRDQIAELRALRHLGPDPLAAAYAEAKAAPDIVVPEGERRTILDLEPGDCRWPMGDPRTKEFHYCNRLATGAKSREHPGVLPYCEFHARRAYQLPIPGQRDRYRVSLITGLTIRKLEPANEQAHREKEIA